MARELIIDRIAEGLFQHTLIVDGEEQQAVIDNSPNLTSFENPDGSNPMDFKTKNGAPLVRAQKIEPEEITITDSFGGGTDQTGFTSDIQVFEALIALGYFERFVTSGGTPSNGAFKNLTDVFPHTFAGLDNMAFFVNEAMNRLEPRLVYNKRYLYELEDTVIPEDYSQLLGKVGGWSTVYDENDVAQVKFVPIDLPQNGVIIPNGFTAIGSFSLEDMVFKALPVFEWDYSNVHYIQTDEFETTINSAGTGNSRVDLIATVPGQNTFQKIEGDVYAGQNTGVKPPLPPGTLELTTLTIYEDTVQEPNPPITGDLYVTKKSLQDNSENASGSNAIIYFDGDEGKTGYNLNNIDLVSLGSIKLPAGTITIPPVLGSYFPITNNTGNDITIRHGIANDVPFINPDGADVTLKNGSVALYRYDGTNMQFISIGYIDNNENTYTTTIIDVAPSGGDFTDPKSALDFITDNSKSKRYIIQVANGTYDISETAEPYIGLKNYVSIIGQSLGGVIVINRKPSFSSLYATFDPVYYPEEIEYSLLKNMTIICRNGKGPVHIDTDYAHFKKGGTIEVNDCVLINENTSEQIHYLNALACGLLDGQRVVARNVKANGQLWVHNNPPQGDYTSGISFELYGCQFPHSEIADVGTYGNDKVIIHGCKMNYLQFSFSNPFSLPLPTNEFSFTPDLLGNEILWIEGKYYGQPDENQAFWDTFYGGKFGITESSIHNYVKNNTASVIPRGQLVCLDDNVKELSVKPWVNGKKTYGITLDELAVGGFGVVQYAGAIFIDALVDEANPEISINDPIEAFVADGARRQQFSDIIGYSLNDLDAGVEKIRVVLSFQHNNIGRFTKNVIAFQNGQPIDSPKYTGIWDDPSFGIRGIVVSDVPGVYPDLGIYGGNESSPIKYGKFGNTKNILNATLDVNNGGEINTYRTNSDDPVAIWVGMQSNNTINGLVAGNRGNTLLPVNVYGYSEGLGAIVKYAEFNNGNSTIEGTLEIEDAAASNHAVALSQLGKRGKLTINPSVNPIFNIPHGLGSVPDCITIHFSSYNSLELREYSTELDITNIKISFSNTPMETTLDVWWSATQQF